MSERTQSEKIGFISLKPMPDGRFQARWWDAEASKYMRRVIPTTSHKEAVKIARGFNTEILSDTGFIPSIRGEQGHTVREALEESIRARRASPRTKKGYAQFGNQFIQWLTEYYAGIRRWKDLRPMHFEAYLNWCIDQGFAFDTVRLRMAPIKGASVFMSSNYDGHTDAAGKVKLPRQQRQRNAKPVPDAATLDAFLAFLVKRSPTLAPMVAVQCLAGLRVREMLAIREQDIDLKKGTLRITNTSTHKVKNADSERTLPLGANIMAALQWALDNRKVINDEGYVFLSGLGTPWRQDSHYHLVKPEMKAFAAKVREDRRGSAKAKAKVKGVDEASVESLAPREFRAAFATFIRGLGADHNATQAYLGQAPRNILSRHYERVDENRLRNEITHRIDRSNVGKALASLPADLHQTYIRENAIIDVTEFTGT